MEGSGGDRVERTAGSHPPGLFDSSEVSVRVHGFPERGAGDQDFQELPAPRGGAALEQPLLNEGLL